MSQMIYDTGWDRGPDADKVRQITRLRRRRATIEHEILRLLTRRTQGGPQRLMHRACRIAGLHGEFHALGAEIVGIELL